MKKLTKEQALEKIEQLKKYVSEKEQEEKGFVIKNWKDETVKLKKNQVEHFLNALGFQVED